MKLRFFTILFSFYLSISAIGLNPVDSGYSIKYKNCYYITLSNDTVNTTILYSNIINLQDRLDVISPTGARKTIYPGEIKEFCIRNIDKIFLDKGLNTTTENKARLILASGVFNPGVLPRYIKSATNSPFSLYFESLSIKDSLKTFIQVKAGLDKPFRYLNYYYIQRRQSSHVLLPSFTVINVVHLIEKDNKLSIPKEHESIKKEYLWLGKIVSDDTTLSKMIKAKELNFYGAEQDWEKTNIEAITNEYNSWKDSGGHIDTALTLKGILDADKYYKPRLTTFLGTTIGFSAFIFPGILTGAIINSHPPKEKNLNLPTNCQYCGNDNYMNGYKMRANYKRVKTIYKGMITGCIILIGAITLGLVLNK